MDLTGFLSLSNPYTPLNMM